MIDTIVLTLDSTSYTIVEPDLFLPSACLITLSGAPIQAKQNPTQRELKTGIYKPRLMLAVRRNAQGVRNIVLKMEVSLPKLFFGNNFQELQYKDFAQLVSTLAATLNGMGVSVTEPALAQTEQLNQVFNRLRIPDEIEAQIAETLNEVHVNKMAFHNQQLELLTKEQRDITKMMDSLYMDNLKRRITETEYDRFFQSFCQQRDDITARLERLQRAETNYYITAKCILDLARRASALFESSEVDEKRQLIKLLLSNVRIEGENVVYDVQKPFDLILEYADDLRWRPQGDLNPCFRRERATS